MTPPFMRVASSMGTLKLTEEEVRAIRRSDETLAKRHRLCMSNVGYVKKRRTWRVA